MNQLLKPCGAPRNIFSANLTPPKRYNFDSLTLDGDGCAGCCHFFSSDSLGGGVSALTGPPGAEGCKHSRGTPAKNLCSVACRAAGVLRVIVFRVHVLRCL